MNSEQKERRIKKNDAIFFEIGFNMADTVHKKIELPKSGTKNFEKLKKHILPLSVNKTDFDEAKKEWTLANVKFTNNPGTCPCSKYPIHEFCYLKNNKNGNKTFVGNVCVYRFIGIDTRSIFKGLERIKASAVVPPNSSVIDYANSRGYLYGPNEEQFLQQIKGKRKLSDGQINWLAKINRRIVQAIVVNDLPKQIN